MDQAPHCEATRSSWLTWPKDHCETVDQHCPQRCFGQWSRRFSDGLNNPHHSQAFTYRSDRVDRLHFPTPVVAHCCQRCSIHSKRDGAYLIFNFVSTLQQNDVRTKLSSNSRCIDCCHPNTPTRSQSCNAIDARLGLAQVLNFNHCLTG